jgi:hypothetical protein
VHLSAEGVLPVDAHVEHEPPAVPQAPGDCGSQVPLLQQPFGQDVALQTQAPFWQI